MESVLGQLITVPGVVGGMVYDAEGTLLSRSFPPIFDDGILGGAARVLVDGAAGLELVTGKVGLLDLRFADARIVVRPMSGASLVLLCAAQTNLQLLNISASVAIPKIERLVAARQVTAPVEEAAGPEPLEAAPPDEAPAPPPPPTQAKAAKQKGSEPPPEDPGFFHW
jgi:predicted regulator of Ras-like GTPase activity (Roadblock/LC7/MglB family)